MPDTTKTENTPESVDSPPFICALYAEGEFEGVFGFDTHEEMLAFSEGTTVGAGKYGAGSCGCYTLEELMSSDDDVVPDFVKTRSNVIAQAQLWMARLRKQWPKVRRLD